MTTTAADRAPGSFARVKTVLTRGVLGLFLVVGALGAEALGGVPQAAATTSYPFTQISTGYGTTCAATSTENAYCWGTDDNGQLGDGARGASATSPVEVKTSDGTGDLSAVTGVALDNSIYQEAGTACAATREATGGHVWCWGTNGHGQLGNDSTTLSDVPVEVLGAGGSGYLSTVTEVSVGFDTACAVSDQEHVWCWGGNTNDALGDGTSVETNEKTAPVEVVGVEGSGYLSTVTGITEGLRSTCALTHSVATGSRVYCWGTDGGGQLGDDSASTAESDTPVEVHAGAGPAAGAYLATIVEVAGGRKAACVISTQEHAYCWGTDGNGQLGDDATTASKTPVEVETTAGTGDLSTVTDITEGYETTCAVVSTASSGSHAYCWGDDVNGQLGNGASGMGKTETKPVEVVGAGDSGYLSTVTDITEGEAGTCAIAAGKADCWGDNESGQIGNGASGTGALSSVPVPVEGPAATAPAAPSDLHETAKSATTVTLAWTAATTGGTAITHYLVYKTGVLVTTLGGSTLSYAVTSLSADTTYHFTVKAENGVGTGPPSSEFTVTTTATAPAAPSDLHETAKSATTVTLAWTAATTGGTAITHYLVYKTGVLVTTLGGSTLSYAVTSLSADTTYHFTVKAENGVGTGPPSSEFTVTTTATAPAAPSDLHETAKSATTVTLAWTAATTGGTAITHYLVYKTGVLVTTLGGSALSYAVTSLSADTTYHFTVKAENGVGTGPPSSEFTVTTTATAPAAPSDLHETAKSATTVTLAWTAATTGGTAITHYLVYKTGVLVTTLGGSALSYAVTSLSADTTYHFTVKAENGVGTGPPSSEFTVTTTATAPAAPSDLHETAKSATTVTLAWTAATTGGTAITHYLVYETSAFVAATRAGTLSYPVTGLVADHTYHFTVTAKNDVGTSPASNTLVVTTTSAVVAGSAPGAPVNLRAAATGASIVLTWTAPGTDGNAAVESYEILRSETYGAESGYASVSGAVRGYTDTDVTAGTYYYYEVAAVNSVGTGPASNQAQAEVLAAVTAATRIYGATAADTAAKELAHQFTGTCPGTASTRAVVLASESSYTDALAADYLASDLGTGILLTKATGLPAATLAALKAEGIDHVYVVGGPLAVSPAVVGVLEESPAYACGGKTAGGDIVVTRIGGATKYTTAAEIAERVGSSGAGSVDLAGAYSGAYDQTSGSESGSPVAGGALPTAIVASGTEPQDAEAAGVLGYADHLPILLTAPSALSAPAKSAVAELGIRQVIVVGGPLAVSTAAVMELETLGASVIRVAGATYSDTAVELADLELAGGDTGFGWKGTGQVVVAGASDGSWSDGIAGAIVAAGAGTTNTHGPEPLLLTESPVTAGAALAASLSEAGKDGIDQDQVPVTELVVLGGPLAVTTTAVTDMVADLSR